MYDHQLEFQLSFNNTFPEKIIRKATNSRFSHIDVVIPKKFQPFIGEDNYLLGSLPFLGVHFHKLSYALEENYTLNVTKEQYFGFFESLNKRLGDDYDYIGVLTYLPAKWLKRDWSEEGKWFCCELIAKCLNENGIKINNFNPGRVSPEDIKKHCKRKNT